MQSIRTSLLNLICPRAEFDCQQVFIAGENYLWFLGLTHTYCMDHQVPCPFSEIGSHPGNGCMFQHFHVCVSCPRLPVFFQEMIKGARTQAHLQGIIIAFFNMCFNIIRGQFQALPIMCFNRKKSFSNKKQHFAIVVRFLLII